MDLIRLLVILFALLAKVVFCRITFPGKQVCYTDVGCFDPVNLFDLGFLVPDTPAEVGTQFLLFTRSTNENNFTILDHMDNSTLQEFDGSKGKTFVVVHGLNESAFTPPIVVLRTAILNKFDANVIMVDWRNGSRYTIDYLRSAVNTQLVGRQAARLLQLLTARNHLNVKNVHLVGHSLGAQVNGFTGKWFKKIAGDTIGRISGLDAAGVWFQLQDSNYHLAKTDADFVDAIHTSSGKVPIIGDLGILTPIGHVDFYPNGGRFQPQCKKLAELFQLACSHEASRTYFAESIADTCPFTSTPCPYISRQLSIALYWKTQCEKPCGNNCGRMGYYSNIAPGRGSQYLTTNRASPYCKS